MAKKRKRARPSKVRKEENVLNNPVAKFMHWFNKSSILTNRKKYVRTPKHKGKLYE
jgi:hypothetical protein